jgi:hypothetical protein
MKETLSKDEIIDFIKSGGIFLENSNEIHVKNIE